MSTATELLEETLLFLDEFEYPTIVEEIRAYLAAEPEAEPIVWMMTRDDIEGAAFEFSKEQVETYWENRGYTIEPLYTRPEPAIRKPMTEEEIDVGFNPYRMRWLADDQYFVAGVRWAEKHHGIGKDDE